MFVIGVSLLTAAVFGTGDFLGGLAAKRTSVLRVVLGSHLVGLVGVLLASLLLAEAFSGRDLLLGAVGGAFGGLGVALLYRRLSVGPMHVVAPLTAITSAVIPTAWGVVIGERLTPIAWTGIALALFAIGLISSAKPAELEAAEAPLTPTVIAESLLAGCGFGAFFIFLDATQAASAPWPVVGARLVTSISLLAFIVASGSSAPRPDRATMALIAATGLFDTLANVGFLFATLEGDLAVVSVLTSLYPVSTVLLARIVLGERMTWPQGFGFVGALGATALIAAG